MRRAAAEQDATLRDAAAVRRRSRRAGIPSHSH